jgi:hypothetical protein
MPNSKEHADRKGVQISGITVIVTALLLDANSVAYATENGSVEYPIGAESIDVGFLPPPGGAVMKSYNEYFSAKIYSGGKSVGGSDVSAFVTAYRPVYTWPVAFDEGRITISSSLVVGGGKLDLKVPTPVGSLSNGSTGLVDPSIWPIQINYHSGPIFASAATTIWIPWGTYNKNAVPAKGLGDNHYTFSSDFYLTYKATPKFQIDLASVTEFNTINHHTHYKSGDDETFTASLSYAVTPSIQVGPTGYLYEQFTDDTQSGTNIHKGNRGQTLAVGAQVVYNVGHGAIVVKYLRDTLVRNRAGDDQFWLQWAFPF